MNYLLKGIEIDNKCVMQSICIHIPLHFDYMIGQKNNLINDKSSKKETTDRCKQTS